MISVGSKSADLIEIFGQIVPEGRVKTSEYVRLFHIPLSQGCNKAYQDEQSRNRIHTCMYAERNNNKKKKSKKNLRTCRAFVYGSFLPSLIGFDDALGKIGVFAHWLDKLYPEHITDSVYGLHLFYHVEELGVVPKDYFHHQVRRVLA